MGAPLKFKPHQIVHALNETRGMIYLAAERLGCEADTIYNYAKRYASVREAITRHRQRTTDIAELKLYQAINDGESWAIQYYLRTQGRDRGYVERHEFTGKDGEALRIHLTWDDHAVHEDDHARDSSAPPAPRPALRAAE